MTKAQALKEAKRRWGRAAHVGQMRCGGSGPLLLSGVMPCPLHGVVGCKRLRRFVGDGKFMRGHGETFRAAFRDADQRAEKALEAATAAEMKGHQ